MSRNVGVDLSCLECRETLTLDERASTKAAHLVYACKGCGRFYSTLERGRRLQEETLADTASRTIRMRAVKPLAAGPEPRLPREELLSLPDGISVALEVTGGPVRGQVYHLDRRMVVIGREEGEVQIGDPGISRRHATLEVHDLETIILRDLSSTNGTYHNDQLIAFCRLQDGDEIRLGSTTITVQVDQLG